MARPRRTTPTRSTGDYRHDEARRKNNPPVGMVAYEAKTAEQPQAHYGYDPHLSPQLIWAGKPGLVSIEVEDAAGLEVDTVSLHIHERVSTQAIIHAVQRPQALQLDLFADPRQPLREAVEFYRHDINWANRLLLGDSLLVMNSLLQRELLAGQVQMIYIDPPYGVKFSSNFQPRIDQRGVREGDDDLTREPEQIKAYRDTWTLGIHSYLTYLRDRLRVARELLADSGSIFVQISDENVHLVRCLMDDVLGAENFIAMIPFRKKTMPFGTQFIEQMSDFLLWYGKKKYDASGAVTTKYRKLFLQQDVEGEFHHSWFEMPDYSRHRMSGEQVNNHSLLPQQARVYRLKSLEPSGEMKSGKYSYEFQGQVYDHPKNGYGTNPEGIKRLDQAGRLQPEGNRLTFVLYADENPATSLTAPWNDTVGADDKRYVVQTNSRVIERCMLMTTDPGDLVLDPTCGSGTTAYVAEQWGRRWITCDTSRVAVSLARQRLLTATYPYYTLAQTERGVDSGFRYKTVPHITLRSIAQNTRIDPVVARYQPLLDEALAELNRSSGEAWQAWEVPGEGKEGWGKETMQIHQRYLDLRRRKQGEIDRIIAEDAPQETLYDQPQIDNKIVRVSGPFTVEAIPPAVEQFMQEETRIGGAPEAMNDEGGTMNDEGVEVGQGAGAEGNHIALLIDLMRQDGVHFPDNRRLRFASLTPLTGGVLHAEGVGAGKISPSPQPSPSEGEGAGEGARVAVSFGPQHGAVTARQVEDGLWEAVRGGYDLLVFAGFAFDAAALSAIETGHPRLKVVFSHIRPDVLLTDARGESLLKTTASAQLFTVFGEPDIELRKRDDGAYEVELLGVDVYDPLTGEVHSARASQVAAWFLDSDYDRRTFHICQAFFPNKSAWQKLARALKGTLNDDLFDQLTGRVSLPFEPGEHRRIAVKVIDQRGNEVMRVVGV